MANILIVDDEKLILKGVRFSLEQDGMKVDEAYDGEEALRLARANKYDLILLDVMLPKIDGAAVCLQIREVSDTPVIMVTAKDDDLDKISAFEYGADDYITKPFNIAELKARVKAILRRSFKTASDDDVIQKQNVKINLSARRVYVDDFEINLTAKEFDVLALLMKNAGKVFSREKLMQEVWGQNAINDFRVVDVHIRRIREKIEKNPGVPSLIITKWRVGYFYADS